MADQSGSARFQSLFGSALQAYQKKTGIALSDHPLMVELESCNTAQDITAILERQAEAISDAQPRDKFRKWIKITVSILTPLSHVSSLADAVGPSLPPPAKAVQAGLAILLNAANSVISSLDALADFLESIGQFVNRLSIYTRIPLTTEMVDILVKIMVELLSTIALVTKELKQGRSIRFVKKLLGEKDVEAVLQRLNRLTEEEARTTAAHTLEVVHGLVQNMSKVMDNGQASIDSVRSVLEIVHEMATDMNKSKRDQLRKDIRTWLSPPDPWKNYHIAHKSRHGQTGSWFVNSNTFSEWQASGPSSLLWIHGKPGAGKSVFCSTIIAEIKTMQKSGLASLAIYFYDFREESKKDLRGLLSSILFQLCDQSDSYYRILSNFYSAHRDGSQSPGDDELDQCLRDLLSLQGQAPVYLIIDALDECPNTSALSSAREEVLTLLEGLIKCQLPNLRVCVTSRPEVDIKSILEPLTFCSVSLHDERGQQDDIQIYIQSAVNRNRSMQRWRPEHKQLVIKVLTDRADGSFRWVYCQLDYLGKCIPARIRHALGELPETLDGTYERTLQEIPDTNWEYARRLLQCVAVVSRPLQASELADFLAFDFDIGQIPKYHEGWRLEDPVEAVLSTCSTLVVLVKFEDSTVIQFSHFSVKEFLTSSRFAEKCNTISCHYHISMTPAHALVAQACLGILLHLDQNVTKDSLRRFPLARYAAERWAWHARFEGVLENVDEGMKQLFDRRKHHLKIWSWLWNPAASPLVKMDLAERPSPLHGTPLYYASSCGLPSVVKFLATEHPEDVNSLSVEDLTPLRIASRQGHIEVARILIQHGAIAASPTRWAYTSLHEASKHGHVELTRLLIEHGVNLATQTADGKTPMHLASVEGHVEVTRLLIEHGADAKVRTMDGETPLHCASRTGNAETAQLLIEHGADVTAQTNHGITPLHWASLGGHAEVTQLLIRHGADVIAQANNGMTPLHGTFDHGYVEVARLLIYHGADVAAQDKRGTTPLHGTHYGHYVPRAAGSGTPFQQDSEGLSMPVGGRFSPSSKDGHMQLARLLIEHGADPAAQTEDGETPLHLASYMAYDDDRVGFAQLLVEYGADVAAQTKDGVTPLHRASINGSTVLARLLIEYGADVTAQTKDGETPLLWASRRGNLEFARLLIQHGADATVKTKVGDTPLHAVCHHGLLELAKLLLDHGADVTAKNKDGLTPLHDASRGSHVELAQLLIDHGANAAAKTNDGETTLHYTSDALHRFIPTIEVHGVQLAKLAQLLIDHGADVAARTKNRVTALHMASNWGRLKLAQVLVKHGANIAAQTKDDETPLHLACTRGHVKVASFLVEHGADLVVQTTKGETPLHLASEAGEVDLAQLLVEHGNGVAAQTKDGETPLHYACHAAISRYGQVDIARLLVEYGADVAAQAKYGVTPLHWASQRGNPELAWFLVEHGANPQARPMDGETMLQWVSRLGYKKRPDFARWNLADLGTLAI